nr:uncharacterized protein LOC123494228 [Aegilops tauschii subsp. strangulata]
MAAAHPKWRAPPHFFGLRLDGHAAVLLCLIIPIRSLSTLSSSGSNVVEDAGAMTEDQGSLEIRTTVLVDVASLPPCFEYLMLLMLLVCHRAYAIGHANMYVML